MSRGAGVVNAQPLGGGAIGSVAVVDLADRSRVVLRGEVDASMNSELAAALVQVVRRGLPADIDARGTTFVDSTVIAAIAHLSRRLPAGVSVIDPPEHVRFLLHISQVEEFVTVTSSGLPSTPEVPELPDLAPA